MRVNCTEARALLHAYADGELGLESALEFERHLEQCVDCRRERGSQGAVENTMHDGYNLLHWRRGGMNYWMASDLNAQEMSNFAGLLRAEGAPPAPHS